ncbi:MAG: OmpH family outer membrane protein [Cyanobacteria bacterium NC_groundwater_1444_Ag_S-0.65um_54_12]|nr:OmpH family outer membrane protein [Cyanobacteria bacterium NC_groundwater_1444_Ag_S-0.65um_54_12]
MRQGLVMWAMAVLLLLASPALAGKAVLGFVDIARLQLEYSAAQEVRAELAAEELKFQAELREGQQRISESEQRIASMDVAIRTATGDIAIRAGQENQRQVEAILIKTRQEYENRLRDSRQRAVQLDRQLNGELLAKVKMVIAEVAKRHSLDGVLDARASLYGALDLTDEILTILNATPSAAPSR